MFGLGSSGAAGLRLHLAAYADRKRILVQRDVRRADADLRRLIKSPVLSREEQGRALMALGERAGFGPLTRQFLGFKQVRITLNPGLGTFQAQRLDATGEMSRCLGRYSMDGALVLKRRRGEADANLLGDGRDFENPVELALK